MHGFATAKEVSNTWCLVQASFFAAPIKTQGKKTQPKMKTQLQIFQNSIETAHST